LARTGLEQSTWENYENVLKNHLIPYFKAKNLALDAIKPKDVKAYYTYKVKDGRKDRKSGGLSHETINKHASVRPAVNRTKIYAHMLHESKKGMADKINNALSLESA
jgi:hypothetical protein